MKFWTEKISIINERLCRGKNVMLGSGKDYFKNCIRVDINYSVKPDIIFDLNKYPYPFKDNVFDNILCFSILEHLHNLIKTMDEIYRILKPGGRVYILVPHFSDSASFTDITHTRFFSVRSFDYFIVDAELNRQFGYYSESKFKLVDRFLMLAPFFNYFRILRWFVNKYSRFYEDYLCFLIRGKGIYIELESIK